jgi:hypothetical protein
MKIFSALGCFLLLFTWTPLTRLEARNPQNHLVPFRASVFDDFRPSLYKKLLLTPGNYGRMIEFVPGPDRGEFAVSLQCEDTSHPNQCSVTLTKLKQNLGSILVEHWGKDSLGLINRVPATRKDAPIHPAAASTVRSTWIKMLHGVKLRQDDGTVVADSERIEFCIGQPNPRQLFAEIPDNPGESVIALIELGRLLAKYCEAPKSQRTELETKIQRDAKQLSARTPN